MVDTYTIHVSGGVGYYKTIVSMRILKGISVNQYINKLTLKLNGFEIYKFVNNEGYTSFTDNNLDLPIEGELEIIVEAPDGIYNIMLLTTIPIVILRPKSEGEQAIS